MSNWAMGWAQRQRLGDPVAKAILSTMCYLMKDDTLLSFPSVPTLEEYTEYDDRTIRKALQRLAEAGKILDTGLKKNNVTVWRIPGYENWLRKQNESPDKNERASETDLRALAQVAELTKQKTVGGPSKAKPPQKGEGSEKAPSHLPASPPTSAENTHQAPPKMGGNLQEDLSEGSSGARAGEPSGPTRALESEPTPDVPRGTKPGREPPAFDEQRTRVYFWNIARNQALLDSGLFGICPNPRPALFDDIPNTEPLYARAALVKVCEEATAWAIGEARAKHPMTPADDRAIHDGVRARVNDEIVRLSPQPLARRPPPVAA